MFGSRGEFLMSQAELPKKPNTLWRSLKLVSSALIIFSIPAALAPLPVEDFMRVLSLWNSGSGWMTAHCLYVVLNIVILALTVGDKSGGEFQTQSHSTISLSDSKSHPNSTEIIDCVSVPRSRCKKSASTTKLNTISQEGSEKWELTRLPDQISVQNAAPLGSRELVVFEICSDDGEGEEGENEEMGLSCEEVDAKAESFIQNFHRQLKMQREDSWKRLSAIYRRSC